MRITARPRVGGRRAAAVSAVTARPPAAPDGGASRRTDYGRAGCLPGGWSLVGGTSRLYRVLCVLRPLLAQVPAAAAHAAPFSRRARRFAVWSSRFRLLGYLSRSRAVCGSVGSVPGCRTHRTAYRTPARGSMALGGS